MAKWQDIKFTAKGKPFVTFYGKRLFLSNFERVKDTFYFIQSAFSAYKLKIDDRGERAVVVFCHW